VAQEGGLANLPRAGDQQRKELLRGGQCEAFERSG